MEADHLSLDAISISILIVAGRALLNGDFTEMAILRTVEGPLSVYFKNQIFLCTVGSLYSKFVQFSTFIY